jgi:S-adenosylmethionine hydrolase
MSAPVITFLSDYGHDDDFVGVCHGVIARLAPEARVIDVSHGIPRHDIRAGALLLRGSLPFMPAGVHLAVVDPDVGAARRAVALRVADAGRLLVGPDNGLLSLAAEEFGGVVEAIDIGRSPFRLEPVSATFHGRDLFAPIAAQLAIGADPASLGDPCDPDALVRLELPRPTIEHGALVAHALYVDRFGNVQLNVSHADLDGAGLRLGQPMAVSAAGTVHTAHYGRTFGDVAPGELLVYEDAHRTLALAVSRGSAAVRLGIVLDDEIRISSLR